MDSERDFACCSFAALGSMVQVADRPVTRQGLAGIKTQSQGHKH